MAKSPKINIFIDAEWANEREILSLQVLISGYKMKKRKYIVINSAYKELLSEKGYEPPYLKEYDTILYFAEFSDNYDLLTDIVERHGEKTSKGNGRKTIINDFLKDELKKQLQDNVSITERAQRLGVSRSTVYHALKQIKEQEETTFQPQDKSISTTANIGT